MAWPGTVSNGQLTDASQYNNLLTSVQTWGGSVSANSNPLTNISAISAPAAAALNITGAPVTFLSPDATHNVSLTVGNTGNPSLTSTSNALATTSTVTITHASGIAVVSPDTTRTGRFACANAADPTLTTSTGTIAIGGLCKVSNALIVYATNMSSGISYNFQFATQNSVATCHTLSVTGAAGILYIASPVSILSTLATSGLATLNSLAVTGATTYTGAVTANGPWTANALATFNAGMTINNHVAATPVTYSDGTDTIRTYFDASHVWHIDGGPTGVLNAISIGPGCYVTCSQGLTVMGPTAVYSSDASSYLQISVASGGGNPTLSASSGTISCGSTFAISGALSVTGASALATLSTSGLATLASLTVTGATTLTSASATGTMLTIANTSTGGRAHQILSGGASNTGQTGWLCILDQATGNIICGLDGRTSTRKVVKLPQSSVIGWTADDVLNGAPDVGLQRSALGVLMVSDSNANPMALRVSTLDMTDSSTGNRAALAYTGGYATLSETSGTAFRGLTVTSAESVVYLNLTNTGGTGGPRTLSLQVVNNSSSASVIGNGITQVNFYNVTLAAVSSAGLLVYSPDASRYLQISCANTGTPTLASSTGSITLASQTGCINAGGFVCYSPADYSRYGSLACAAAAGSNPTLYSSTGVLNITGNCTFSGTASFAGSVTMSPANLSVSNQISCASFTSPGFVDATGASAALRALNTATVIWYNAGNAAYAQCTFATSGHPIITSSTGFVALGSGLAFGNNADLFLTRYAAGNLMVSNNGGGVPCSILAGNFTAYNSNLTSYVYMNGGTSPPAIVTNAAQLNCQVTTFYVTGSVSALAHNIHGSGYTVADVHRSFLREEPVYKDMPNPLGELEPLIDKPIVPPDHWGLCMGDDGLHIVCKRSDNTVHEFVLPWEESKLVQ